MNNFYHEIALTLIPGIGNHGAKKLIAYCGGAEAVFKEKKSHLLKIPGLGITAVRNILNSDALNLAEQELDFMEKNEIQAHFFLNKDYPSRLVHCDDGPVILYSKGKGSFNSQRVISIVGTRNATIKGKINCEKLVEDLTPYNPTIISGLAYGIDIKAHKEALKNSLITHAVLASNLSKVYPPAHSNTANEIQEKGLLLSDYPSSAKLMPGNFAERNRIVAGMCDALIVMESSEKGGSLISADLANGYNRDVFAYPGRVDDSQSVGCNRLIKTNKAALIESAKDIAYILGWEKEKESKKKQIELFIDLNIEEEKIVELLNEKEKLSIDEIALKALLPMSKTSSILLSLEFKGLVRSLPGKIFEIIS